MILTTPFTTYPPLHQLLPIRSIIDPNLKIVCPCNPSRYWSPANPDNPPPCSAPLLPTRLPQLQPRTARGCTIRGWVRAPCLLRAFSGLCNLSTGAVDPQFWEVRPALTLPSLVLVIQLGLSSVRCLFLCLVLGCYKFL